MAENENETQENLETVQEKSPLEQSKEILQQIKLENDRMEKSIRLQQELAANELLSGKSSAGQEPEKPKEETPQEYAKRVMENNQL